jgi:hypothetical protein
MWRVKEDGTDADISKEIAQLPGFSRQQLLDICSNSTKDRPSWDPPGIDDSVPEWVNTRQWRCLRMIPAGQQQAHDAQPI